MRLKIFTGDNMTAALAQVRQKLGEDAIIINSTEEDGKVKVTAAVELPVARVTPRTAPRPRPKPAAVQRSLKELEQEDYAQSVNLSSFLTHHGIDKALRERIVTTAESFDEDRKINGLARALDVMFHFSPINNDYQARPLMLTGPPGVGKTVTAAKLASQAVLTGQAIRLISTDTVRTGGTAQLEAYAGILKTTLIEASEPDLLAPAIETGKQTGELVIIDTMGYNPLDGDEMAELHRFIRAYDVEPLLVIAAGTDATEAREIAETYSNLGVRRFIATRLDVARRYGSLLATAASMDLAFAGFGITPYLAKGIERVDALSLARLLARVETRKVFIPAPEDTERENMEQQNDGKGKIS